MLNLKETSNYVRDYVNAFNCGACCIFIFATSKKLS
jgi:hypothetical protein